jgi:predicted HTH domain antitoxin
VGQLSLQKSADKIGGGEMFSLTLDFPSELSVPLSVAGYNRQKLTEEAKRLLAVALFQRNALSLGQAAKLAEMPLWDFIQFLGQQGIPVAEYDDEEIQQQLETVEWMQKQLRS